MKQEVKEFRFKGVYNLKLGGDLLPDQEEESHYSRSDVQIQNKHQDVVIWAVRR